LRKLASQHEKLHMVFCYSNPLDNEKEAWITITAAG